MPWLTKESNVDFLECVSTAELRGSGGREGAEEGRLHYGNLMQVVDL